MASFALAMRRPHLLFRKLSPQDSKDYQDSKDRDGAPDGPASPRLCTFSELPKWYQDNPHILTHYRPVSNSYNACINSLLHLHNETLNVYTHLIPALVLALALPTLQIKISSIYAMAPWTDRFMLTLTPMAVLLTLSLSSTYHTLMSHSCSISSTCLLLDYTGILALILTSFITGIYVGFYDSPFHQRLYWSMIASLVFVSCMLVLHPRLQGPVYRPHRTTAFILTALSGFAPVIHGAVRYGAYDAFWYKGVMWWLAEGFWYGVGAAFFATRFPESCAWAKERVTEGEVGDDGGVGGKKNGRWRGKFDVFGSSHQIFHVCVVLGAGCHCWGVWWAWRCAV